MYRSMVGGELNPTLLLIIWSHKKGLRSMNIYIRKLIHSYGKHRVYNCYIENTVGGYYCIIVLRQFDEGFNDYRQNYTLHNLRVSNMGEIENPGSALFDVMDKAISEVGVKDWDVIENTVLKVV